MGVIRKYPKYPKRSRFYCGNDLYLWWDPHRPGGSGGYI